MRLSNAALLPVVLVTSVAVGGDVKLPPMALDLVLSEAGKSLGAGLAAALDLEAVAPRLSRAADERLAGRRRSSPPGAPFAGGESPPWGDGAYFSLAAAPPAVASALPRVFFAQEAPVQGPEEAPGAGEGHLAARAGIGFTLDPDTFLMSFEADYVIRDFEVGPLLQLGVGDERLILAPTVNARWRFALSELAEGGVADRLLPFIQGGLGFAYINRDNRPGDDDEIGFLLNLGFGFDYEITDRLAVGNHLLFNVLPDEVLGENFFFSWQFVGLRFRF